MQENIKEDAFFRNLSECAKNLIANEQSIIMGQLKEAIKEADGKDAQIKAVVIMEIHGPELVCNPRIETARTVKTRNECADTVTADSTPDMFKKE